MMRASALYHAPKAKHSNLVWFTIDAGDLTTDEWQAQLTGLHFDGQKHVKGVVSANSILVS